MRKNKCKKPVMEVVAYLSTTGPVWETEMREKKQEAYIREYAKANNIDIVGIMHRKGMGQREVNRHFNKIVKLIFQKRVAGVIIVNTSAISPNIPDAYYKIGKIKAVGGVIITVDEGSLGMEVKCVEEVIDEEIFQNI